MSLVVVGGNSHGIGKTSVMTGIIQALPHHNWTAIKLTQFGHQGHPAHDEEPACADGEQPFSIQEELDRSGRTDTSRFLMAGARRALWVRVPWGRLEAAVPQLRSILGPIQEGSAANVTAHVIIESNSIVNYFQPGVYLSVLDPSTTDFKTSARELIGRVDAFLLLCETLGEELDASPWEGIPIETIRAKPVFPIRRDCYVTPEVARFVESRLAEANVAGARVRP